MKFLPLTKYAVISSAVITRVDCIYIYIYVCVCVCVCVVCVCVIVCTQDQICAKSRIEIHMFLNQLSLVIYVQSYIALLFIADQSDWR